jgi:diaminopropionate ammonia-lyase
MAATMFHNLQASFELGDPPTRIPLEFHRRLPGYRHSPLIRVPGLARCLGVGNVWVKDESCRLGLPSFKVMGASWAVFNALAQRFEGLSTRMSLDELAAQLAPHRPLKLVAATDGNHGRAVAWMAKVLGLKSRILVPSDMVPARRQAISSEGAEVVVVDGNYDDAVTRSAEEATDRQILVSDTSWPGYETIPHAVIDGYSTILWEIEDELRRLGERGPDLVVVQIGVGAFASAVIRHFRRPGVGTPPRILGVEPANAACVLASLQADHVVSVSGALDSIMSGLNCGTPSLVAWPYLRRGIDAVVAIEDERARQGMRDLATLGIKGGECAGAGLGALAELWSESEGNRERERLGIDGSTCVLLFLTEGVTDPSAYAEIVTGGRRMPHPRV